MAFRLLNNARMSVSAVASAGTGAFTLNAAESGYQSFTSATPTALGDGDTSTFIAVEAGGLWELFTGTYTAAGTSLARTTTIDSSNGGANETFTTACTVSAVADVANLLGSVTEADGNFVVGTGSGWTAESGATARTSMGAQAQGDVLDDLNTLGASTADGEFLVATGAGTLAWEAPATALVSIGAQASDAELTALAGLTSAADALPYFTGSGTASTTTLTSFARSILDDANEATFKATVNLEPGTDVQAYSTHLNTLDGLSKTDGNFVVTNGSTYVAESGSTARTSMGAATDTPTYHVFVPALAMYTTTTNGAAASSTETTATRPELKGYDFDASTDEFVQFCYRMSPGWNESTITAQFVWTSHTTEASGNVIWGIQAVAFADSNTMDAVFGTAVTTTDAQQTIEFCHFSSTTSAMTVAGTPGAGELVFFQVYRDANNASDTFTQDATLLGVVLSITMSSTDDGTL